MAKGNATWRKKFKRGKKRISLSRWSIFIPCISFYWANEDSWPASLAPYLLLGVFERHNHTTLLYLALCSTLLALIYTHLLPAAISEPVSRVSSRLVSSRLITSHRRNFAFDALIAWAENRFANAAWSFWRLISWHFCRIIRSITK